jgi:hypothetical protein
MNRHAVLSGLRAAAAIAAVAIWATGSTTGPLLARQTTGQRGAPPKPASAKPAPAKPAPAKPSKPPDPRTVVTEAQKRATVDSQHYEGTLRVTDAGGLTVNGGPGAIRDGENGAHVRGGFGGALLAGFGFWVKARLEEGFLREQLGAEAYDAYGRRVPMLVPFGPA